jgi:hypothetical protein
MLTGEDVAAVHARLPLVRVSDRRRKFRRDYVNVGELRRLALSVPIGRRVSGWPPRNAVAVLRIPNHRKTGWHWSIWSNGVVMDQLEPAPVDASAHFSADVEGVSHYPLTARA